MATPKQKPLTHKQILFVKEYIIDFNASRAALAAKYSTKTAPFIGAENLKKPQIQKAVQKEMQKRVVRLERTADEVVKRLWDMQDIDIADYKTKRQTKSTELLMRHYGLFKKDNEQGGVTEVMLLAILATLPPDQAEKTRIELIAASKAKK